MEARDSQTLVMCVLLDGPEHGYAINTAIERLTGERLGASSLYGALARLEAKGLIESLGEQGRQRPVRLTGKGREVLERELRTMAAIADSGLRRLGIEPA